MSFSATTALDTRLLAPSKFSAALPGASLQKEGDATMNHILKGKSTELEGVLFGQVFKLMLQDTPLGEGPYADFISSTLADTMGTDFARQQGLLLPDGTKLADKFYAELLQLQAGHKKDSDVHAPAPTEI